MVKKLTKKDEEKLFERLMLFYNSDEDLMAMKLIFKKHLHACVDELNNYMAEHTVVGE